MFSIKKIILSIVALFLLLSTGLLVGRYLNQPIEEIQQLLFYIIIPVIFVLSRYFSIRIPLICFLAPLFLWIVLAIRIPVMRELGFYKGRIIIGKFENDKKGFESREVLRGIKKVSRTYDLPGVNVLPLNPGQDKSIREPWLSGKNHVSLLLTGSDTSLTVFLPQVASDKRDSSDIGDDNFPFKRGTSKVSLPGYKSSFIVPGAPEIIHLPITPLPVMTHYLAWLSAFYHPDISKDFLARIDVINEAARIKGPWNSQIPKVVARYLFSYQEFLNADYISSPREIVLIKERLERALLGLEQSPHPELYASTLTLIALCEISQLGNEQAFTRGRLLLEKVVNYKKIPINKKLPAIYNLAVLLSE